jgi:hypothetical protein
MDIELWNLWIGLFAGAIGYWFNTFSGLRERVWVNFHSI